MLLTCYVCVSVKKLIQSCLLAGFFLITVFYIRQQAGATNHLTAPDYLMVWGSLECGNVHVCGLFMHVTIIDIVMTKLQQRTPGCHYVD